MAGGTLVILCACEILRRFRRCVYNTYTMRATDALRSVVANSHACVKICRFREHQGLAYAYVILYARLHKFDPELEPAIMGRIHSKNLH